MNIQRLRNLTTRMLHTQVQHIYEDLVNISGVEELYTHMLPDMLVAVEPFLVKNITDKRFWDGKFDSTHTGEYNLPEATEKEKKEMQKRFKRLLNGKATQ